MESKPEEKELDLGAVVHAVRSSSDRELAILAEISKKLSQPQNGGYLPQNDNQTTPNKDSENNSPLGSSLEKPIKDLNKTLKGVNLELNKGHSKRANETTVATKKTRKKREWKELDSVEATNEINSGGASLTRIADLQEEKLPTEVKAKEAKSQNQTTVNNNNNITNVSSSASVDKSSSIGDSNVSNSVHNAMDEFKNFWKDEKGQLRRANGQYASKEEKARYKSASEVSSEREAEKTTSVLGKLITSFSKISDIGKGDDAKAVDATGVAAGSSYFYAAKELFDVGSGVVEKASDAVSKVKERKEEKVKEKDKEKTKESTQSSSTQKAIEHSQKREQVEVIKEQTESQATNTAAIIKKIDEIDFSVANDKGLLGDLASVGDLFDGPDLGGDRKDRRSKAKTKRSRWGQAKSVFENGSESVTKNKSFGSMLKAGGSVLTRFAAPIAALAAGADKFMEVKDREDLSSTQKAAQVGSTGAGAAGGAAAGAMLGATVGSAVPIIGTAIGGIVGAVLGGLGGTKIGEVVGEGISNFIGSDSSLYQYVSDVSSELWGSAQEGANNVMNSVKSNFQESISSIQESATSVWDGFTSSIGSLIGLDSDETEVKKSESKDKEKSKSWFSGLWGKEEKENTSATSVSDSSELINKEKITTATNSNNNAVASNNSEIKVIEESAKYIPQKPNDVFSSATVATQNSTMQRNDKVSELKSRTEFNKERKSTTPQTVSLDKKSLDAISKNNNAPVIQKEESTTNPNVPVKASPAKMSGSDIPNNFIDLSLQRQAADLE